MSKESSKDTPLRVVGVPRRRVDARGKVTGRTRFADHAGGARHGTARRPFHIPTIIRLAREGHAVPVGPIAR